MGYEMIDEYIINLMDRPETYQEFLHNEDLQNEWLALQHI